MVDDNQKLRQEIERLTNENNELRSRIEFLEKQLIINDK